MSLSTPQRIIVIAQARMGSSRLPGKVLKKAGDYTIIEHLVRRVLSAQLPTELWIATTDSIQDDALAHTTFPDRVKVFRGDEHDVLARYYHAAVQAQADIVVRVTGDCPLLDASELDRVISVYIQGLGQERPYDYVTNQAGETRTIPRGLDVEVMSMQALQQAYHHATQSGEREHVTPYLYQSGLFHSHITHPTHWDLGHLRLTVDTPQDLSLIQHVFQQLGSDAAPMQIADYLAQHPEIYQLNAQIQQRSTLSVMQIRCSKAKDKWLIARADRSFGMGSGHVARLSALCMAWIHIGGKALLIGGGLDDAWCSRLQEMHIDTYPLVGDDAQQLHDSFRDCLSDLAQNHEILLRNTEWIAFDGYEFLPADLAVGKSWQQYQRKVLLIDDHALQTEYWYQQADLIVNQNLLFDVTRYPVQVQSYCYVGSSYVLLRPDFWDVEDHASTDIPTDTPTDRVCTLLITFGSSDPQNVSYPLLQQITQKLLSHPQIPPLHIYVLVGPAFQPAAVQAIEHLAANHSQITILSKQTQLAPWFTKADLAITAGGTTTWELMRCNVWPLVLRVAENQDVVMEGLAQAQVGVDLGVYRQAHRFNWDQCLQSITDTMIAWKTQQLSHTHTWVDGRGVWRIIDTLLG